MKAAAIAIALMVSASSAWAEDKLGVAVYPGAKFDAQDTAVVKQLGADGACYRTNEAPQKLVEFYKKQSGLKPLLPPPGVVSLATVFQKGQDIQVRIQSPEGKPQEAHLCIVKD